MSGKVSIDIAFPIISFLHVDTGIDISVSKSLEEYAVCKKAYIPKLNKLQELIIDSTGFLYKRNSVRPLRYINIFNGFSLKSGGFGVCFLNIELEGIKKMSEDELKHHGLKILESKNSFFYGTTLPIKRWRDEFVKLSNREDILRYMFYFAATSSYYDPDKKDNNWRERKGFVTNN